MTELHFVDRSLVRHMFVLTHVPSGAVVATTLASLATLLVAVLQGWPLWAVVTAAAVPWIPVTSLELIWTSRHFGWLALFSVLVVTQTGHFLEHMVQVAQIHLLGTPLPQARGVFGALDIEWVHFAWNTWVLLAVLPLLRSVGRNAWLWVTLLIAAWHALEHFYMIVLYLDTGRAGDPGLLAMGGRLGGGVSLSRPDLHFLYNLVETAALVIAFVSTLRRLHREWLATSAPRSTTATAAGEAAATRQTG